MPSQIYENWLNFKFFVAGQEKLHWKFVTPINLSVFPTYKNFLGLYEVHRYLDWKIC